MSEYQTYDPVNTMLCMSHIFMYSRLSFFVSHLSYHYFLHLVIILIIHVLFYLTRFNKLEFANTISFSFCFADTCCWRIFKLKNKTSDFLLTSTWYMCYFCYTSTRFVKTSFSWYIKRQHFCWQTTTRLSINWNKFKAT